MITLDYPLEILVKCKTVVLGCSKLGYYDPGLVRNLISDLKALKKIQYNSFVNNLIIRCSKKE